MAKGVTPEEIQSAMAVYASDDESRLRAGGDETEIVALTDGGTHRLDEVQPAPLDSAIPEGTEEGGEASRPAFPL